MAPDAERRGQDAVLPEQDSSPRVSAIGSSLLAELAVDERLQSGVPERLRARDLDFIQMSGLVQPNADFGDAPVALDNEPRAAGQPREVSSGGISFFEKGVEDVDAEMAPPALEEEPAYREELECPAAVSDLPRALESESVPDLVDRGIPPLVEPPGPELVDKGLEPLVESPGAGLVDKGLRPLVQPSGPELEARSPVLWTPTEEEAQASVSELESHPVEEPEGLVRRSRDELAELSALIGELAAERSRRIPSEPEEPDSGAGADLPADASREETHEPAPEDLVTAAEELLQELESQARDPAPELPPDAVEPLEESTEASHEPLSRPDREQDEERDATVYRRAADTGHRRRAGRHRSRTGRRLLRWSVRLVPVAAVAIAAGAVYWWSGPLLESPEALLGRAQSLESKGQFAEASAVFVQFAERNPNRPEKAEAQFLAAHCAELAPADSQDTRQARAAQALALYERFIADNPVHAKVVRARVRLGILHADLGQFREAVELLQDPTVALTDPESALPALRTLAQARWKLGEYEAAASAYSQAAGLPGNSTRDQDYEAWGDLCRWQSDRATDDAARQKLQRAAVEHWTEAMRSPGIDPGGKNKIAEKRRWLLDQLGPAAAEPAAPLIGQTPAPEAPTPPPAPAAVPANPPESPPSADAVDPRLEVQYPGASAAPPNSETSSGS